MIKKGDFIKIEYTARLKENGFVFDTTNEKLAKETGIFNEKTKYGPIVIVAGAGYTLKGLDKSFEGKKETDSYTILIKPEDAFGKRSSNLIKLIPMSVFKKNDIMPVPGLTVNTDGVAGVVRSVSGGRVIVDFNHPFAGKDVEYDVNIEGVVKDTVEKLKSLLIFHTNPDEKSIEIEISKEKAKIKMKTPMIKPIIEMIEKEIKRNISELNSTKIEWDVPDLSEMIKKAEKKEKN
ncbi:MAG: peptidylprolyl isomerase [Candidatus Nanoarchaeia archaeon]|nr:peptidylprolyl isomerase [Candidatus Nanoarchaeia archaeon]